MNALMVESPPIPAPVFETASRNVVAQCSALFRVRWRGPRCRGHVHEAQVDAAD